MKRDEAAAAAAPATTDDDPRMGEAKVKAAAAQSGIDYNDDDNDVAFSASASIDELFSIDEASFTASQATLQSSTAMETEKNRKASPGVSPADVEDIEVPLLDDPFAVPNVDADASYGAVDGLASGASMGGHQTHGNRMENAVTESVLSAVDLLCDDLYYCKTEVLRSFARTRSITGRTKVETVLHLIEAANRDAHGENRDLSVTKRVLGDVFDETVRTSGLRTAWTNKTLEASHIEMACDRHLRFEVMANTQKTLMVRRNAGESARVLRRLARIFQQEHEAISIGAVGGVFRTFKAEADELVRELSVAEVVSPFASYIVSYVRYGASANLLTRTQVNDRLVQLELVQPTVQEMDDTTLLHKLMDILDVVVEQVERRNACFHDQRTQWGQETPEVLVRSAQAFSEVSHTKWNTNAAPAWVHDLARAFCSWEAVVRTDLPRFEDVPRYVFDCIFSGVVSYYLLQRIYEDIIEPSDITMPIRMSIKKALEQHFSNQDSASSALHDLLSYVQAGSNESRGGVRGEFFISVLSQMQGAFHEGSDDLGSLHDERVAVALNEITMTASRCTRSCGLFHLLVKLTEDLRFHFRFQRIFKKLSGADRKTIRTRSGINMVKTLNYFEKELRITPISTKAVGFLVVQLVYLSLRGDGSRRPVLERFSSSLGVSALDMVGLTEVEATQVRDLRIAFPPQLSYNSWLNESDTKEKSVYNVLPSVAVKGSTNQAMIVSQAPMMKALDAISRVPWRINKYMLHVQEAIVREGFGFGKIKPGFYPLHYFSLSHGDIKYPSDRHRASSSLINKGANDDDDDNEGGSGLTAAEVDDDDVDMDVFNLAQRRQFDQQQSEDWKQLSELRSTRIHYLQALRQARSILQFSHIYFPNSMDFRGRMYPLPGRLNHTGSDPFRGLLEYAEPKPLGKVGLYWLKVHLANKMGMSKLSFDERVHYVDEHMEDVIQSAESPLHGDRWWQEASEPLQCLMACKEVANAMKCSQGPENFLSRLPVAVDGSYNGLQHYSAIGRDAFGAALVNLVPSERPSDAYTGILKEMMKSITADAARDHQVAQRCLGSGKGQDKDHIKRKTIKRPIMTQVYGVTGYGMSEQILDELVKQNRSHGLWTTTDMKEMSAYLREKVLESLGVTFRETQNCRKWISEVVELIWRVQPAELRNALCWTTPLGLVVRQPYKVRSECPLFTAHGYTKVPGDSVAPASRKQLTAIAPNLIHSLDATHLAMTALEMQHQGLAMMAVHDSYWTYACDLPKLSQILREQFVNLYSKYDPLWELKEQWEETYFMDLRRHGIKLPDPPKRGDLDLNVVLNSPYFFS